MTKQLAIDFTRYPESPGFKRRGTSERAAREMANKAPTLRDRCLEVLRNYAMTADEIALALGCSVLAIRPRITELYQMGSIEESDTLRMNDSGRMAMVWRIRNGKKEKESR